jgi:hypothetical protein
LKGIPQVRQGGLLVVRRFDFPALEAGSSKRQPNQEGLPAIVEK